MTAAGVKAGTQKAIKDTLQANLSTYLSTVYQRQQPNYLLTPVYPEANMCPLVAIYDDGGSQEDFTGYVLRKLNFHIFVVTAARSDEEAAAASMEYIDAVRACLEANYTLRGEAVNVEILSEDPTGDPVEAAGGVIQAGGLRVEVWVGHARGSATT